MEFRPLFIMGCPRSGTTFLASMLANSEQSFALPEMHYVHDMLKTALVFGNDKRIIEKTLTSSPYFLELRLCNSKAELDDIIGSGDPIEVIENILKKYLRTYSTKTPSLWIEHSPRNFRFFHVLRYCFPATKFIHIIRDGRAAYNSVKKPKWGPVDVVNGAEWWSQNVSEWPRAGEPLSTGHYEGAI